MIGDIEQKLIDTFAAASGTGAGKLGYTLKDVDSYGGQLSEGTLKNVVRNFPCVYVMYAGEPKPEEVGGGAFRHRPVFTVFFGQRNRRNEAAQRRGADGKVGSYQMLQDGRRLIAGKDLGLPLREAFAPGAVRSILQNKDASIYALEIHAVYDEDPNAADPATLGDFSTFHADWDTPPHGNVTAPLPAAQADASDTLTNLETA